jgi:beta-lactamase class C
LLRFIPILWLLAACAPNDQPINQPDSQTDGGTWADTVLTAYLERHIRQFMTESGCPGLTVVATQSRKLLLYNAYGQKDVSSPDSVDVHTLFRLGSVSKGFTGLLASILINQGYFALDDPISKFLPECHIRAKNKDGILRVGHILSQATGFTEHAYSNLVDMNHPRDVLYEYILRLQPRDSTGVDYAYQNVSFGLIEEVIEKTTGMSFEQAMDFYLLSPLSMCSSGCSYDSFISSQNRCSGHTYKEALEFTPTPVKPNYYNLPSAGGIHANGHDMKIWLDALIGAYPSAVSQDALQMAFTPYVNTGRDDRFFNVWPDVQESYYGLGWRIVRTPHRTLAYHGGLVNNFRTEIAIDQQNSIGVVFLFNSVCDYANEAVFRFFQELDCYQYEQNSRN